MGKRILYVGDVHGHDGWNKPVTDALSRGADVVFLGDYLDSFNIDGWLILENFRDIIALKKKYKDKINLLLGNHDYAYMFGHTGISGFNSAMWNDYRNLLVENWDLFDLAYGIKTENKYTLVTHAGLTTYFYEGLIDEIKNPETTILLPDNWKNLEIHELINYFKDQSTLLWIVGRERGGWGRTGSILWADKRELIAYAYKGIDQVVGHTPAKWIEQRLNGNDKLYFVDSHMGEYVASLMMEH